MNARDARLSKLESGAGGNARRWHRIIQRVGQSFDDTLAQYHACNGAVKAGDGLIVRNVIAPVTQIIQAQSKRFYHGVDQTAD